MKKVAILYSTYTPTIDAIKTQIKDCEILCFKNPEDFNPDEFDLVILSEYNGGVDFEALNIHRSLLPAFKTDEPVRDAVIAGVKVTGITVYYTKTGRILAQYPIFINNDTHYDELIIQLKNLEQIIYPLVIEKILNNEPFEIQKLLNSNKSSCGNKCGDCGCCGK